MKLSRTLRHVSGRTLLYAALIVSSFLMIVPFYWSVSTSLKLEQFVFATPPQWWPNPLTLENYVSVFTKIPFPKYFLNSVFVAVVTTLAHVFFDTLAAYAFAKLTFPGRDKLFFVMLLGLMIPFQVNLIPLYRIMATLNWTNTYLALIVPNLTSIFGIFMMRQFLITIPNDLLDAARIDGCDEFQVFRRVRAPIGFTGYSHFDHSHLYGSLERLSLAAYRNQFRIALYPASRIGTTSNEEYLQCGADHGWYRSNGSAHDRCLSFHATAIYRRDDGRSGKGMIGAIDIGGTKFAMGIVSETGEEVIARTEIPSNPELGVEAGISKIIKTLRTLTLQADEALQGIGIGCTGPVYPFTGELGRIEFLPGWEGVNLVQKIQDVFDVSVAIENDADAAALGEYICGAGKGTDNFIYLTVSTGIGGGVIINKNLYRGAAGSHPEIGHHVIDPTGPKCFCGARGCWESLASGPALARSRRTIQCL